jgi:hypothetical protein
MRTISATRMKVRKLRWVSSPRAALIASTVDIAIHATPTARAMSGTTDTGINMMRKTKPGEVAKNKGRARDQ